VEVLHWWTSGGEAAALNVLKDNLAAEGGIGWVDMPVAGGGGEAAMTALRARVTAGDAPTAVQMLGFDIQDWAGEGALADLTPRRRPKAGTRWCRGAAGLLEVDGKWIAAPVNVHSTNWVWINKAALDATGLAAPTTWEELVAVLDKMKANGITPLGHGGQPWQDATVFDGIVLSLGGDFYKAAFIDLDPAALAASRWRSLQPPDHALGLCRRQLLGPRLEPRLGHGHQRRSRACR
jgi:glucose/mannose transport system substrate-binding protein